MISKIIYITSLAHSGSTLLNLLLGNHENAVSLGEVSRAFNALSRVNAGDDRCSCGLTVAHCPVWSGVWTRLDWSGEVAYLAAYQCLLEQVERTYGDGAVVVESSKTQDPLSQLYTRYPDLVSAIYLVRDLRGYVHASHHRGMTRRRARTQPVALAAWRWHRENRAIKAQLDRSGVRYFQLGYEELCSQPGKVLELLAGFTGIALDPRIVKPTLKNSHVLRGNRMRKSKRKMSGIRYDDSWTTDAWLRRRAWLLLPFLRWNAANAYPNALAVPRRISGTG